MRSMRTLETKLYKFISVYKTDLISHCMMNKFILKHIYVFIRHSQKGYTCKQKSPRIRFVHMYVSRQRIGTFSETSEAGSGNGYWVSKCGRQCTQRHDCKWCLGHITAKDVRFCVKLLYAYTPDHSWVKRMRHEC